VRPTQIFHHHATSAASWASQLGQSTNFDPQKLAARASQKAQMARTRGNCARSVILEPAAALDLVGFLFYDFAPLL
jgi:hypothetical protein